MAFQQSGQVFISYSREDYLVKEVFRRALEKVNLKVWSDNEKIEFGDNWKDKIVQALKECRCVVLLASPDALVSKWVREELTIAESLNKKIFPVMIRGEELPFGVNQLHFFDARKVVSETNIEAFVLQVRNYVQNSASSSSNITAPSLKVLPAPPVSNLNKCPIDSYVMRSLLHLLQASREELISTSKDKGRASLLWVSNGELSIIAATDMYQETELKLRLKKGQGVAGEVWEKNEKEVSVAYPHRITRDKMKWKWNFNEKQIQTIRGMGVIVSATVYKNNEIVGILSLDNCKSLGIRELRKRNIFDRAKEISNNIANFPIYSPCDYLKYLSMQTTVQMARLIAQDTPVNGAIYWIDELKNELYLAAAWEEDTSEWSTSLIRYKLGEGIIGQAWDRGYLLTDDNRENKTKAQIMAEWNINEKQYELEKNIKSIVAAPIRTASGPVLGVLVVSSNYPIDHSVIGEHRVMINEMANLLAKLLIS